MRRLLLPLLAVLPATALAQVPFGPEFTVTSYTSEVQRLPRVGADEAGRFVVVWHRENTYDFEGRIYGQRFDPAGRPLGGEFRVGSGTGMLYPPSLAVFRDGSFVVVWTDFFTGVRGRRLSASGVPLGAEFVVSDSAVYPPQVSLDGTGKFVVVWADDDGGDFGVFGQRLDSAGNRLGAAFQVNTYTTGFQRATSVAVAPGGAFMVVWESHAFNDVSFGRRYDAQGTPLGSEFRLSAYTTGEQSVPDVGVDSAGNYVVVWEDFHNGVAGGRRFNASGSPLGAEFTIAPENDLLAISFPKLAVDPAGAFAVVWMDYNTVYAKRFDAGGTPGSSFRVDSRPSQAHFDPVLATVPGNGLVVAWWMRHVPPGILARRFAEIGPTALVLDTAPAPTADGNGVLEPGEAVAVGPTWRNSTAAPRPASGTISQITGPGAPSLYSIVDSAASYGTLPANGSGSCAGAGDCYAVRVANPGPRPAAHWDATFREDVTAGSLLPPEIWALHVGDSFADVPRSNPFYRFIEALLHHDVVTGCQAGLYCPQSLATREQIAVFVLAGLEPAWFKPDPCVAGNERFADVPASSPFCPWIEELSFRGVVGGCGGGNYCPTVPVSREQMAVFVLATLEPQNTPPACAEPRLFADVPPSSPYCRYIEELARRGIVSGCGGGNYCPTAAVSREQMSAFITGTFGLTLYGP